ncbi:MAG: spore cortex biosynthesis protein YabQ [Clostridia bacterium]|nr:spore cortex biosynthesis protein YabQ [Clostridia bacterium]
MFQSLDQPRVFLACALIGVLSGVYYEPFALFKRFIKKAFVKHVINSVWLTSCSLIFITFGLTYEFPNFRLYMALGVGVGIYLYKLSFHKVIAIFTNKVYNITNKLVKKIKAYNERRKEKANILGGFVGAYNVNHDTRGNNNLSTRRDIHAQKQNSRARRGDRISSKTNRTHGRRNRIVGT